MFRRHINALVQLWKSWWSWWCPIYFAFSEAPCQQLFGKTLLFACIRIVPETSGWSWWPGLLTTLLGYSLSSLPPVTFWTPPIWTGSRYASLSSSFLTFFARVSPPVILHKNWFASWNGVSEWVRSRRKPPFCSAWSLLVYPAQSLLILCRAVRIRKTSVCACRSLCGFCRPWGSGGWKRPRL